MQEGGSEIFDPKIEIYKIKKIPIMLMKSRKSFNLSVSFSFSLKFKNVSLLPFTYSIQMCVSS